MKIFFCIILLIISCLFQLNPAQAAIAQSDVQVLAKDFK